MNERTVLKWTCLLLLASPSVAQRRAVPALPGPGREQPHLVQEVESTTLADIIRRNTTIGNELQDDVFHVAR